MDTSKLKVGDKVVEQGRYNDRIGEVVKITPSGLIDVAFGVNTNVVRYNQSGSKKTSDIWNSSSLMEWTQELEDKIVDANKKLKICNRLEKVNWSYYDLEVLEQINNILGNVK